MRGMPRVILHQYTPRATTIAGTLAPPCRPAPGLARLRSRAAAAAPPRRPWPARCAVSELALPGPSRVHHPPPGDELATGLSESPLARVASATVPRVAAPPPAAACAPRAHPARRTRSYSNSPTVCLNRHPGRDTRPRSRSILRARANGGLPSQQREAFHRYSPAAVDVLWGCVRVRASSHLHV